MSAVLKAWAGLCAVAALVIFVVPQVADALNILEYSDRISDSAPLAPANHTLRFTLNTNVSPNGVIEITPPSGFEIIASSTFAARNVELSVNGIPRDADTVAAPNIDQVEIFPGVPGMIRYTLAPNSGLVSGEEIEIKIGNHTSNAFTPSVTFSSTTGTTTIAGDIEPIINSGTTGTHEVKMEIFDGGLVANAGFLISLNDRVNIAGVDTTEEVPPVRFGPAPTSTVGGTTLNVEISLETDEFAICRYSTLPDIPFGAMTGIFSNTGVVFHSTVVPVVPNSLQQFFVRCIDDEGNFNIDDFVIEFTVNDVPTGSSNTDGDVDGDGTGTGNDGGGDGAGSGGTSGEADGEEPLEGGSSGSGGSGGGSGGGGGGRTGSTAGGGFESQDAPYRSGDGRVVISGFAFPNSEIIILVDGQQADSTRSGSTGSYEITLDEIARGVYTFGIYGQDQAGVRSSTFSTSFTVTGARTSALSNINIAPSIAVSPNPVDPGQTLTVSGYALPNSTVTLENGRLNTRSSNSITASAGADGRFTTSISTTGFSRDTYQIRARAEQSGGAETNFSDYTFYGVGQSAAVPLNSDLNRDGKVNLTDFSILLFWWSTDGGESDPPADINQDNRVNLTDFSILLFNWTG